jgi:cytochrome bd-type quinol oxidase subunit 2
VWQVGRSVWRPRFSVAAACAFILAGYWLAHYPIAIRLGESNLSWQDAIAPDSSLRSLTVALVVGLVLIGPGLAYLYKVFKS